MTGLISPFWTDKARFYADYLWLPPNEPLERYPTGSWFTVEGRLNQQNDDLMFYRSSWLNAQNRDNQLKTVKIRLYPTVEQRQMLMSWFGTARWTYNEAINQIQQNPDLLRNRTSINQLCVNGDVFRGTDKEWILETPQPIREGAIGDLLSAYKSAMTLHQSGINRGQFEMHYRTKRDLSQSIVIRHRSLSVDEKSCQFYPKANLGWIESTQGFPEIHHDCRLQWLPKLGHFYLCIPVDIEVPQNEDQNQIFNLFNYRKIIAIDPGVITFSTTYDYRGICLKWGHRDIGRICRLCHYYDNLQSRWSQRGVKHRQRYRMKRAGAKMRLKIRNLVDDLHRKLVKYLCDNYNVIIIPRFDTSQMILRGQRRINSATARKMVTWAHFRFRQRLLSKAREYTNCNILVVDESYTSKTCGRCGMLNEQLGGHRVFRCAHCGLEIDRDINGARNILIKTLSSSS